MLFVDKYCPNSFQGILFNHKSASQLIACAHYDQMPHLIIKGSEGSGKKTFANLYIKAKYGETVHTKQQTVEITSATKTIELQMLYSDYHYQIDPSLHGVYDRVIVQGFIKDILQVRPISRVPYHIIIMTNADRLTLEAQQSLRRTLEKNISTCRFIFLVDQESSLIDSLISRCVQIRLSAPTIDEIESVLMIICQREKVTCDYLHQIAIEANRSLTHAIHRLQQYLLTHSSGFAPPVSFSETSTLSVSSVDTCLDMVASHLTSAKTPEDIQRLRPILYDLLVQCVEPIKLMKGLFQRIFVTLPPPKQHHLIQLLAKYENTLKQGSKPIYHLEGFCLGVVEEGLRPT